MGELIGYSRDEIAPWDNDQKIDGPEETLKVILREKFVHFVEEPQAVEKGDC